MRWRVRLACIQRVMRVGASDSDNTQKLLDALKDVPEAERTARFICVMVFMEHAE